MNPKPRRPLLLFILAAAAALTLAACGGDDGAGGTEEADGDGSSQVLALVADASGKVTAPASVEAGLIGISLDNQGDKPATAQLIRVEGDHSAAEAVEVYGGASQGKPLPDWFFAGGGVDAEPGQTAEVTQVLDPGTYFIFGNEEGGPPKPADVAAFEVTGEPSGDELASPGATVTAVDYSFKAEGLKQGENTILFENAGAEPHHILAFPLLPGRTIEDVKKYAQDDQGPPPVKESEGAFTAILEGGDSQIVTLDLPKSGSYALLCFISDRAGGPPHAFKGMVSGAQVE